MSNIRSLRRDPSRFSERGVIVVKFHQNPGEVTFFGFVEKRGRHGILGRKVVVKWGEHRDESVVSVS